jgi:MFS family permease
MLRPITMTPVFPSSIVKPTIVRARQATAAIFFFNGVGVASWAVRIPAIKDALHLSDGTLGVVLLAIALGSLVSMPFVGRLCERFGSGRVTTALSLLYALALTLPTLAGSVFTLVPALFVLGATNGGLDVAMNTQATSTEHGYRRPILSSFHALWSVGSLIGAAAGGLFARLGAIPEVHLGAIALLCLVAFFIASRFLLPHDLHDEESSEAANSATPAAGLNLTPGLLAVGGIAFAALLGEGAIGDWSAVYLSKSLAADAGLAAAGFTAFQFSMAALRFAGDELRARLGDGRVVLLSGLVAMTGLGFGLIVNQLWALLIGFALVGAGFAVIFPAALGLVSKLETRSRGPAIAWVSTVGYAGFLVGPPLIGLLSEATSLRVGLATVAVAGAAIAALSSLVRARR